MIDALILSLNDTIVTLDAAEQINKSFSRLNVKIYMSIFTHC